MLYTNFDNKLPSRILFKDKQYVGYWDKLLFENLLALTFINNENGSNSLIEYISCFCPSNTTYEYKKNKMYMIDIIVSLLWKKSYFCSILDAFMKYSGGSGDSCNEDCDKCDEDACEDLSIDTKNKIYLLDNLFRCLYTVGNKNDKELRRRIVNYIFSREELIHFLKIYHDNYREIIDNYNIKGIFDEFIIEFKRMEL